jgi:hypothetical protein
MLLVAPADLPYGYYTLLRLVVTGVSVLGAAAASGTDRSAWLWAFGATAFLFNPIIPIYLDRDSWAALDLIAAAIMATSILDSRLVDGAGPLPVQTEGARVTSQPDSSPGVPTPAPVGLALASFGPITRIESLSGLPSGSVAPNDVEWTETVISDLEVDEAQWADDDGYDGLLGDAEEDDGQEFGYADDVSRAHEEGWFYSDDDDGGEVDDDEYRDD